MLLSKDLKGIQSNVCLKGEKQRMNRSLSFNRMNRLFHGQVFFYLKIHINFSTTFGGSFP
jgi:hypothetical protein